MMFIQFFIWGAWYITVGTYMKLHGMADGVKWAYTVCPIAAIISPFFLGMVADRFFATEKVMGVLHVIGGVAMLLAPSMAGKGWIPFVAVLLVHTLCYMPTLGLTNTISFANMTHPEKQFPMVRVFGTIGWIIAGWVIGIAAKFLLPADVDRNNAEAVNNTISAMSHFLYITGGAGILLGIYSFTLPHTPPPAAGKPASVRDILGLDALALLGQPSFAIFIIGSFLICIPLAAYYAFAPIFAGATGIKAENMPIVMSFGQISEIFFMLIMPIFFARLGAKWMLAVGMLAWVVRYGLFAGAWTTHQAWMVTLGIILHGICYDFFFVTGFIYTEKKAPAAIRGQAQGFLVLVTQGLGLGIGAQVMGRLLDWFTTKPAVETTSVTHPAKMVEIVSWTPFWLIPCVMALIVLVVFVALFKDDASQTSNPI